MAMFDGLIRAGQAVLEGRAKPRIKNSGNGPAKRGSMADLIAAAQLNPRVRVSLWENNKLVPVPYAGSTAAQPQKDMAMPKNTVTAPAPAPAPAPAHAHAPRVFMPRCTCSNAGTCRACKVAAAIVCSFTAMGTPEAQPAAQTVVAKPVAAPEPAPAPLVPNDEPSYERPLFVAMGLANGFQAIRDTAHAVMLRAIQHRVEALQVSRNEARELAQAATARARKAEEQVFALQLQLDAARAGHATQVAALQAATAPAADAALACYRCHQVKPMGYVLDGQVCCRDCRPAHREDYYASRGQAAPARQPRTFNRDRGARVSSMTVHADNVTVAAS